MADHDLFFARTGMDRDGSSRLWIRRSKGADDGELFLEYRQTESFSFDDGRLKAATFDTSQGFGLRAVAGEATGYAHATEMSEDAIARAADTVQRRRAGLFGHSRRRPAPAPTSSSIPTSIRCRPPAFEKKVKLLEEMNAYARSQGRRACTRCRPAWRANGSASRSCAPAARSIATSARWCGSMSRWWWRRMAARKPAASAAAGAAAMKPISTPTIGRRAVDEALRQALVNLASVPAPAGEMTVVLGPGWPGILLHEAIGHGLEGDFNRKKTSAFAGLLGERVAAPGVTVVDDGTIDGRRGSLSIDDEGTPTRRTVLIEDGILKGYMQDRQNARLMGVAATGNGRRQSYCLAGDAAHDQHLHAGRRQGPRRDPGQRQEGHLRHQFRRRPGGHHQRQVRLLLHRGLSHRGRQARPCHQGRHPDRHRAPKR